MTRQFLHVPWTHLPPTSNTTLSILSAVACLSFLSSPVTAAVSLSLPASIESTSHNACRIHLQHSHLLWPPERCQGRCQATSGDLKVRTETQQTRSMRFRRLRSWADRSCICTQQQLARAHGLALLQTAERSHLVLLRARCHTPLTLLMLSCAHPSLLLFCTFHTHAHYTTQAVSQGGCEGWRR